MAPIAFLTAVAGGTFWGDVASAHAQQTNPSEFQGFEFLILVHVFEGPADVQGMPGMSLAARASPGGTNLALGEGRTRVALTPSSSSRIPRIRTE